MRTALAFTAALALAAPIASAAPPADEASASQHELGQMNRDFCAAINAGDAKAAAALYTEDATLMPPGEAMVVGRAAIEAYWQGFIDAHPHDVATETLDAKSSGALAYEAGRFQFTMPGPDGEDVTETGRFIEILRKGADGKWYSTHGIWNNDPAEE